MAARANAEANARANARANLPRDPDGIIYRGEDLYYIDKRFSTTTYGDNNILIKLLFPYGPAEEDIAKLKELSDQEVAFQNAAAKHNLGPRIYASGLYMPGKPIPFSGYTETNEEDEKGDTIRIPFIFDKPFYYIIMEYYSRETGWNGPVYVSDERLNPNKSNNDLFYEFVKKLVTKAHIANTFDPIMHFYYHPDKGLRMIDYGRCVECYTVKTKKECIDEMCVALTIQNKYNNQTRSRTRSRSRGRTREHTRERTPNHTHNHNTNRKSPIRRSTRRKSPRR